MRRAMVLAVVMAMAAPGIARAGRSDYAWLFGSEVLPERGVELQQWVWEEDDKDGTAHTRETSMWWAPTIGVTDQLEISLPVEFGWHVDSTSSPSFTLQHYGLDARYRFVSQDPVDRPAFAPLLRVAVKRDVTQRDAIIGEADLVGTYDVSDDVQLAVDVGFSGEVHTGNGASEYALRPGLGVSVKAVGDLRLGAEAYAEVSLEERAYTWVVVGPDVAVTHGRFWLSAAFGIGVYQISYAPRLVWGVLF